MKIFYKSILIITLLLGSNIVKADNWLYSLEDAKKMAIATNKLILVDFWAFWCGPCKKMDAESWSKDEIKEIMNNYVSVKIDIDIHKDVARKYNVQGIPYIFIMDPNGEVVYHQMSYLNINELKQLLVKYSLNTNYFQKDYLFFQEKENSNSSFRLAQKYQNYAIYLDEEIKNDFLTLSRKYLKKTESFLDEGENKPIAIRQKIKLIYLQEKLIKGSFKKCSNELRNKYKEEEIDAGNKSLFYFLNYVSCKGIEDDVASEMWLTKLKSTANHKSYIKRAEKILI